MSTANSIHPPRVLVFDSGVGGLSVLDEIRRKIAGCELVYAFDNEAFPYGTKAEEALVIRVDAVLKALINRVAPDIIVVACNTASTLVLPRIRSHFLKPVVGVVPAIKPAARYSSTRHIGLLGTPGTVQRLYTQQLIDEFAADCTVVRVGSSELVEIAEAKLRGRAPDPERLRAILAPFFAGDSVDTVVLACTHFPLLRAEFEAVAPRLMHWMDSGEAIARRVESLLPAGCAALPARRHFSALLTASNADADTLLPGLYAFGCDRIEYLTVHH